MPAAVGARALALAQPLSALLELTYRCNWRCVFCYNPRHSDIRRMSANEWNPVLDDLRALGTLTVTLTGGEPLTHPEFFGIARAARARAFAIRIFTNGTLIDDEAAEQIAALRPSAVEMSLHGATAETHEKTTAARGSFQKMFDAIERLRKRDVRVHLKSPVTSLNEGEIDGMIEIASSLHLPLGLDATITPRDNGDASPLTFTASLEARRRIMQMTWERKETMQRQSGDTNCGLGRITLAIDPEGNVYPCMQWRHQSLGNVRTTPLAEMWRTSPVRHDAAQTAIHANDAMIARGGSAATFPYCPALAYQERGDPLTPDHAFLERAALAQQIREELSNTRAAATA